MHDQRLERLTYFSDAVFAIAMTLLVIELRVPHIEGVVDSRAVLQALADMIPNFIGFVVSFLVIGIFWVSHHRGFALTAHYGPTLAWPNLWLLLSIVFLPFSSALMSDYYGARVPHMLYMANLAVAGLLQRRLMGRALADDRLLETVDPAEAHGLLRRMWAPAIAAGLGMVVAIRWAPLSTLMLLLIPPLIRVLERSGRRAAAPAGR